MSRHSASSSVSSSTSSFPTILGKDSSGALVYGAWAPQTESEKPLSSFISAQLPPLPIKNGKPSLLAKAVARSASSVTSSVATATVTVTVSRPTLTNPQKPTQPTHIGHRRRGSEIARYDMGAGFHPPSPANGETDGVWAYDRQPSPPTNFPGGHFPNMFSAAMRPSLSTGSINSVASPTHPLDKTQPLSLVQQRLRHTTSANNLRRSQFARPSSLTPKKILEHDTTTTTFTTTPATPATPTTPTTFPFSSVPNSPLFARSSKSSPLNIKQSNDSDNLNVGNLTTQTSRSFKRFSGLFDYDLLAKSPSSRPPGAFADFLKHDYEDYEESGHHGESQTSGLAAVFSEKDVNELRQRILQLTGDADLSLGIDEDDREEEEGWQRKSSVGGVYDNLDRPKEGFESGIQSRSASPELERRSQAYDHPNRASTATTLTFTTNRSSLFSLNPENDRRQANVSTTPQFLSRRPLSVATTFTTDTVYTDDHGDIDKHTQPFRRSSPSPDSPLTSLSQINLSLSILTDLDVPPSWQTQFQDLAQACLHQSEELEQLAREMDETQNRVRDLITMRREIDEQLDDDELDVRSRIKECEDLTNEMQLWMESMEGVKKEVISGGVPIGLVSSKPFPQMRRIKTQDQSKDRRGSTISERVRSTLGITEFESAVGKLRGEVSKVLGAVVGNSQESQTSSAYSVISQLNALNIPNTQLTPPPAPVLTEHDRSILFTLLPRDLWAVDERVKYCQYGEDMPEGADPSEGSVGITRCDVLFSWFNRRHHCRRCGKIFCAVHTGNRLLLYSPDANSSEAHSERVVGMVTVEAHLDKPGPNQPTSDGEWSRVCDCCFRLVANVVQRRAEVTRAQQTLEGQR